MALTPSQSDEVIVLLDRYAGAYRTKDIAGVVSLLSNGISGFGSGPDEVIVGLPQLRQHVARDICEADSIAISFRMLKLDGQMPFAWVTTFCAFHVTVGGKPLTLDGRMTALFRHTGNRWLIEQLHFSVPDAGQEQGESYPGSAGPGR